MCIVVTKSPPEIVRPSEPVTTTAATGKIIFSPFDKPLATVPVVVLQVFEHPIHEPVETIRRGLSHALVHYYPLAGRLAGDDYDDVHIDCTGEGVTIVAASANCTVKQLMRDIDGRLPDPSTAVQRELIVDDNPAYGFGRADPLILMQVTTFTCGGFVIGVTWNHGAADGFGIAQFLQAVGELARGLPTTSVIPVRSDKSLQAMSSSTVMAAKQFMFGVKPTTLALHSITIPARVINGVRGPTPTCTVFEAVAAVMWRCRTRVVMSDPDAPTVLAITVNSRKYVGVKDGYYGNCATMQMAVARSGVVADGDMMEVVRTIRRAKEEIPERLKKGDAIAELSKGQLSGYESVLLVTCWRNIGFEAVDFGGGRTARVMTTYEQSGVRPLCVVCLPWQGEEDEGARVLSGCVTPHHADAFLREIATL
ncbi:acyl transferase 15-like [Oryza sativa Japonica Group]|nr:acyl transferase 15-like [Oryza sativa Japonica Group]AAL83355.1 Putative O-deacetylbaccatin III-10-0-acetyltransferase [Oryza sativa Japonica Group]AAN04502.1 Putative O-deacetylbaccatin III-10-0-acetyltransferase [Oryza sativa Japonica Group]AAP51933.1 Transferase family protein, expressed [Oryza sativa Japonica Group]BAT09699.1 Os10g0122500 [Oryza sativa Japonica Group]